MNHMYGGTASPNSQFPQTIHNVSGDVEEVISNKNKFNPNAEYIRTRGTLVIDGDTITFTGVSASSVSKVCWTIPIEQTENVIISVSNINNGNDSNNNIRYKFSDEIPTSVPTDNQTQNIIGSLLSNNSVTITPTAKYLLLILEAAPITLNHVLTIQNLMVRQYGNSTYTSHQEQTLPFTLEEGQKMYLNTELKDNGINDVRNSVNLKDLEWTFKNTNTTTGISTFSATLSDRKLGYMTDLTPLSSHFQYLGTVSGASAAYNKAEGVIFHYNYEHLDNKNIYLNTTIDNLTDLQTWLNTNNPKLEYELAETAVTPYTATQQEQYNAIKQAKSYMEQTNISGSSTDLSPICNVVALKNI